MNNVFSKTPKVWPVATALVAMCGCTDQTGIDSVSDSGRMTGVVFKIAGAPAYSAADGSDRIGEVNVFHFNGEEFLMHTLVEDPYAESVALPSNGTTRVYCTAGLNLDAEGLGRSGFAATTVAGGKDSAPMFYSGMAEFSEESVRGGLVAIEMKRGVARIDFVNSEDTGFVVTQVTVEDAPAESFVFASDSIAEFATVSYTREFSEPFYGTEEGLFTLFESAKPVHVRILGEYKDSPLNIRTTLPAVERNKAYTLQMVNANSTVEGAFTIKEWEEGSSVSANPSASGYYAIDRLNSSFPEGVTVDYGRNIVTVPHTGASGIKVAFTAPEQISITSLEGEVPTVKIIPNDPVKLDEGVISSFNIDVEPNDRLAYKVTVNLRDAAGRADFLELQVMQNPSRAFDTVEIGGRTWMAFNSMSADPANQVFPTDGMTVEEMYQKNWAMAIGSFFQFGRAKAYSPWTRNDPNGNEETERDIPWTTPECMPVPPGYHVATSEDWLALMPKGVTFPSTYKAANGEEIKAELITLPGTLTSSPSANANKAGLLMRYLRLESLETGNVLIIPICALKTASLDEFPGGGRLMHAWTALWIAEDRYVWVFQISGTAESPTITQGINRWNYNGFMGVRAVKNID